MSAGEGSTASWLFVLCSMLLVFCAVCYCCGSRRRRRSDADAAAVQSEPVHDVWRRRRGPVPCGVQKAPVYEIRDADVEEAARLLRSVRVSMRCESVGRCSAESNPLELLSRRTSQPSAGVLNPDLEQPEHCGDMEGAAAYTPTSRSISAPVSFMLHPVMSLPTDMQPGVARWDMEESSPAGSPHKAGSAGGTFSVLPIARVESVRDAQRGESAGSPQKAGTSGGTFSVLPIARVESVRDAQRGGDMEESASAGSPHKAAGCGAAFSVLPIERVESVRDAQRGESGSPPKAAGCGATFSVPPIERVESVRDAQRGGDMEEPAPATEPPSPAAQGSGDAVGAAILQPCAHPLGGQQYSSLHFD